MKDVLIIVIVFTFLFALPVITYGHCANNKYIKLYDKGAACIFVFPFYPLYWSWEFQRDG